MIGGKDSGVGVVGEGEPDAEPEDAASRELVSFWEEDRV